jgi:integrase
VSFSEWARKQGYREQTIDHNIACLKSIARRVGLDNLENVKTYIANSNLSEARKQKIAYDFLRFCKFKGLNWVPPKYKPTEVAPFIPTEEEITQLISGMSHRMAAFLQLLKETGVRAGEGWAIKWSDIDTERRTVTVVAEKHSYSRTLKISDRCIAMLNMMTKTGKYVFHKDADEPVQSLVYARRAFERRRKRVAAKLQNTRLLAINFRTMRHFRATMLYHRTKDLLLVKSQLGHRSLTSTLRYTHLVNFESDDYVCKVAKTVKEATELVEAGFDYVCDVEGCKVFRKRK